jgi:hypothetical protein
MPAPPSGEPFPILNKQQISLLLLCLEEILKSFDKKTAAGKLWDVRLDESHSGLFFLILGEVYEVFLTMWAFTQNFPA